MRLQRQINPRTMNPMQLQLQVNMIRDEIENSLMAKYNLTANDLAEGVKAYQHDPAVQRAVASMLGGGMDEKDEDEAAPTIFAPTQEEIETITAELPKEKVLEFYEARLELITEMMPAIQAKGRAAGWNTNQFATELLKSMQGLDEQLKGRFGFDSKKASIAQHIHQQNDSEFTRKMQELFIKISTVIGGME
eukprot:TRINITY_DN1044_c0_g1_i1.p1 TRINITY_DN1044_c0_g1~~TRINITY_DN1044_c0_g1_i1.p1  ORF type:complete len:192 (-),score=55.99 TRINITY_DN1044_c0_g1_i1:126-701(-)